MISTELAAQLRDAGVTWHPRTGDRFTIRKPDLTDEVFTISDMMIEAHEFSTGTVLGFNGTTEWALDSVAQEDALWLPHEEQLRDLLGGTFRTLSATDDGYVVTTVPLGTGAVETFRAASAADAYGLAVLALVRLAMDSTV